MGRFPGPDEARFVRWPGFTGFSPSRTRSTASLPASTGSHGFLLQGGVFTPVNFPLATSTTAWGISDTGEIAGFYNDAAGNTHGFIYADGAFSTVDVAGARGTQLTRIRNGGTVTGACADALNGQHGLTGQ